MADLGRSLQFQARPPCDWSFKMSTVKVTDESFEKDVLQSGTPVLVDFWAEWCGPCKQIAPALEQISEELAGAVTIAKVNIEESPTTPSRYGVRGIPTMMLFRDGQMASMKVGAMPKQKILEWLSETGVKAEDAA
jgi:thioredoxin 1